VKRRYLWLCPVAEILEKNCFMAQNFTEIGQSGSLLSYSQKRFIFNMAAVRHLEFKKKSYSVTWLSSSFKSAIVHQISSKSAIFWDMAI